MWGLFFIPVTSIHFFLPPWSSLLVYDVCVTCVCVFARLPRVCTSWFRHSKAVGEGGSFSSCSPLPFGPWFRGGWCRHKFSAAGWPPFHSPSAHWGALFLLPGPSCMWVGGAVEPSSPVCGSAPGPAVPPVQSPPGRAREP